MHPAPVRVRGGRRADDVEEEHATAAQPVYADRLIDGGNLPADVSVSRESQRNADGWPRAFRVQATTSRVTRNDVNSDESGVQLGGMLDTPNYGALSLEANLRTSAGRSDSSGNLFSLHQIGLPMNGGWLVNNSMGATNAPAVDLARSQYRFFVPVILSNGATTEWRDPDHDLQLHASVGQPGLLTGIYVPTFEDLGGRQASAGAQWGHIDGWSAALQATDVEDVRFGIGQSGAAEEISSQSWFGAVGLGHLAFTYSSISSKAPRTITPARSGAGSTRRFDKAARSTTSVPFTSNPASSGAICR